jgi:tRNA (guanine-N7-)-methyltransferase
MGRARVRKHANPFNCRVDLGALDRAALFGREADLEVELGPGSGSFLFDRARNNLARDFVGLEVRHAMVEQVMLRGDRPPNAIVLYANATENLRIVPPGVIRRFHVHFPDPWPKKRHWKRRVVQPATVRQMCELLPIAGDIYAQTDVEPLAREMFAFFSADGALVSRLDPSMRVARPVPELTDWERHHEASAEPIYRMLFQKVREPSGPIPDLGFSPAGDLPGYRRNKAE